MSKRGLALLCALCCLVCVCRAEGGGMDGEAWEAIVSALASDAEAPVPEEYRIQVSAGDMNRSGAAEEGWLNLLVCSTDSKDLTQNFGRSDALLACRVNLANGKCWLLSLPEEALLQLPELPQEIALRYVNCFGGPRLALRALNDTLGLRLNRYIAVNMDVFTDLVDKMGGVKLELAEDDAQALEMEPGMQTLSGSQALSYLRLRRAGDGAGRMRALLEAVFSQFLSMPSVNQAFILVDMVMVDIDSNLTTDDIINLVFAVMGQEKKGGLETRSLFTDGLLDNAERQQVQEFFFSR